MQLQGADTININNKHSRMEIPEKVKQRAKRSSHPTEAQKEELNYSVSFNFWSGRKGQYLRAFQ